MRDHESDQIVGIDLGTTYCLVAALVDGQPTLIPNGLGELLTPSAVSLGDDGRLLVGAPARARATTHPEATVQAFKRDMGTDRTWTLGDRELSPIQLSAALLKTLKEDAEAFLGHPVTEAVVTVPAYFGDAQRQATRDAGELVGLVVERIINEPTAAALAYGLNERHRDLRVAVLDLGGGTFDVTILEIIEGCIEVQSSAGDARLGGEDFVDALVALATEKLAAQYGPPKKLPAREQARVRQACETAKKRLSNGAEATVAVARMKLNRMPVDVELPLTRAEAEAAWQPLLERIRFPVMRALRDSPFCAEDIDEVLLVGGATRMPCVVSLATEIFGKLPRRDLPPDEAIALGAALQAALKQGDAAVEDLIVTDVAPFTLGVESVQGAGQRFVSDVFAPIIDRGTVIPTSRVQRFCTMSDYQTHIEVIIYQGEHARCSRNQRLGKLLVANLPAKPAGELDVDIRFTYDLNGILEVETTVLKTGRKQRMVLENRDGGLSERELEAALEQMQRLKFHPREALPNTTALTRAEALFATLTGEDRQVLGAAISAFRGALEGQEPEQIAEGRAHLVRLTEHLRH